MFVSQRNIPNSKIHGANLGPIWVRQDPGGPHVGPMNFAIWDESCLVMSNFVVNTVPADGLAPLGAWLSAVTVITKYVSFHYMGLALELICS